MIIPTDKKLTDNCRNFLSACLKRNPSERIDFEGLLQDPFVALDVSIPSEHSVQRMLREEELGAEKESLGCHELALEHYQKAMEYAKTLYYYAEEDCDRKKWKKSLIRYKRSLASVEPQDKRLDSTKDIESQAQTSSSTYEKLYEISKGTPRLRSGLEICRAARNYQLEGDISHAIDRYTAGLGVLMPLLQSEPRGQRRDLLHEAITHWLGQAEALKAGQQAEENVLQGMEALAVNDKTCTLQ